jgi:hypothetical protein
MGLVSGGTYYLCDACTNDGNSFTATTVWSTPHPTWSNLTGGTAVQNNAVTLGGFNGYYMSPGYEIC